MSWRSGTSRWASLLVLEGWLATSWKDSKLVGYLVGKKDHREAMSSFKCRPCSVLSEATKDSVHLGPVQCDPGQKVPSQDMLPAPKESSCSLFPPLCGSHSSSGKRLGVVHLNLASRRQLPAGTSSV